MKDKKGCVYVPIYFEWLDVTQDLTAEEKGHLIDAVVMYASDKDEWIDQLETSGEKIAFRFMRGQVDRNKEISKARSLARSNKQEQNGTNENKGKQNRTKDTKEKKKEKEKDKNKDKEILFDRFWESYPRKVNKTAAKRAFDKLNADEELLNKLLVAVEKQKKSTQWQENEGQFIPHPATWLNGHRWEDELKQYRQTSKTVIAQQYTQPSYDGVQEEAEERWLNEVRAAIGK